MIFVSESVVLAVNLRQTSILLTSCTLSSIICGLYSEVSPQLCLRDVFTIYPEKEAAWTGCSSYTTYQFSAHKW